MDQEDNKASYIQEIRKKYPKAGTKWEKEEDELLQKRYKEKRNSGFGDFELFAQELAQEFSRAPGGIKARLAMHFTDVPGWDYERQERIS